MPTTTRRIPARGTHSSSRTTNLTRRGWLAATGAGTAAMMLKPDHLQAHLRSKPRPA